jgi:hypothetical protein
MANDLKARILEAAKRYATNWCDPSPEKEARDALTFAYKDGAEFVLKEVQPLIEALEFISNKTITDPAEPVELRARAAVVFSCARRALAAVRLSR